jgi:cell division protein FtsW (lipid II flippase)
MNYNTEILIAVILLILVGIVYFFPSLIVNAYHPEHEKEIKKLNLFFGWTIIGWILALVWAIID